MIIPNKTNGKAFPLGVCLPLLDTTLAAPHHNKPIFSLIISIVQQQTIIVVITLNPIHFILLGYVLIADTILEEWRIAGVVILIRIKVGLLLKLLLVF